MTDLATDQPHPDPARAARMRTLALASTSDLEGVVARLPERPGYVYLRRPETGLTLIRARAGGTGRRFNLGEATMTRCAVQLADGRVGHGYVLGRDRRHAELAAVLDAVFQGTDADPFLAPLAQSRAAQRQTDAAKAAATKVEFFTVARES